MAISITSPNVDNYARTGGVLYFKREGDTEWRDLGNAPQFSLSQDIDKLEHKSARTGKRVTDRTDINELTASLAITLEELTPRNLGIRLMGDPTVDGAGVATIEVGKLNEVKGAIRWVGDNTGPSWTLEFPYCSFFPDDAIDFVSDEYMQMQLSCDVLWDDANARFGTAVANFGAIAAPGNTVPPYLYGPAPQVGVEMFCYGGVWTGSPTLTYQWQNAGVDIPDATEPSYTPVVGDEGDTLTCVVTATNPGGTGTAETAASEAVIAA